MAACSGLCGPAQAAEVPGFLNTGTAAYGAIAFAIAAFAWAFVTVRKLGRDELQQRGRIATLEAQLNDAEQALSAEPCILIVWRGREHAPGRIIGDMRGAARVPATAQDLMNLDGWLDAESAAALVGGIAELRESGAPFNFGIRTLAGELLEADGRTAGGLATLRLRPLAGERLKIAELDHDARGLGRQVERLSAILDAAPLPVWLRDAAGQLIWVNRAYIKAVDGADVDQVIAARIEIGGKRGPGPADPSGSGAPVGRDHAVIGGTKRALDIHDVALNEGSAGFAVDVTALEEAHKELKRHIDAHSSTLDKLDTAIAIFGADQRLRFHNAAYAQLWGFEAGFLAQCPSDGEVLDQLRERRLLPEQANFRDWKARQLKAYTAAEPREDWWYLPDGRSVHVVTEQHPFGGVTYFYENATDQIQMQSRINELAGMQNETLDNLNEGVALFGMDGRLRLANPAFGRLLDLDQAALADKPHIDSVADAARRAVDEALHWDMIKYAVTGLEAARQPLNGRVKRRDRHVLEFASIPLPDGNTLLTYTDATDSSRIEAALRERAEALEAADQLKTDFMSNVSYHLRTPLTTIKGLAETMAIGVGGKPLPKHLEYLTDIGNSSEELMAIIDAILDLTTIDAGAMELKPERLDVADLMEAAANGLANRMERRDMSLDIELAEDAAYFTADRKRVTQVLRNLLSNAIGFSPAGGTIRMGARRDGGMLTIFVADSGRGIDPEFQKQAFDRFQSRSVAGGHRGPGLGLAIVKSFVELHGGDVSLISRLERGTTVICRFPVDGPGAAGQTQAA